MQNMQWKQFSANYKNRLRQTFYQNSVDRRDLMSIRSGQMMKKSNDWIFFQ